MRVSLETNLGLFDIKAVFMLCNGIHSVSCGIHLMEYGYLGIQSELVQEFGRFNIGQGGWKHARSGNRYESLKCT